jgi:integrase
VAISNPQCVCKHRYLHHPNEGACTECACKKYKPKPRRTKGDGALYKRADGMWLGRVELPRGDGNKRRYKTVSSKDRNVAIRELKKLRSEIDAGRIPVTGSTTVQKWLEHWIEKIHGPKLRPGSKDDYARTIRLHINPHIGSRRLDKLTPAHIRNMQTAIESSRTAQLAHIILQRALKDAVREGLLGRNVAEVTDKPRHVTQEREPLSADQAKQLLRSAVDNDDPMATRWAAAFLLGARRGEILGLQWSRVDLNTGTVDLAWQLQHLKQTHGCGKRHGDGTWPCGRQRVGYCPQAHWDLPRGFEHHILHRSLALTRPKTKSGTRSVPIPAPLWAMLEQLPRGEHNPHDLVWHTAAGRRVDAGRPIHPRDDYTAWQAALKTAGLPPAPLHAARHTTASLLMAAGVDGRIIQAILGHANIITTRGYQHDTPGRALARQAMGSLDDLLS